MYIKLYALIEMLQCSYRCNILYTNKNRELEQKLEINLGRLVQLIMNPEGNHSSNTNNTLLDAIKGYAALAQNTIEIEKKGKIEGNIGSIKGISENGIVEIGYGINDGYENKGYTTEAVQAVVKWAAKQPNVNQIEAEAEESNPASIRVLEKCNFVPNGEMGEEGIRFVWKGQLNRRRKLDTFLGAKSNQIL